MFFQNIIKSKDADIQRLQDGLKGKDAFYDVFTKNLMAENDRKLNAQRKVCLYTGRFAYNICFLELHNFQGD